MLLITNLYTNKYLTDTTDNSEIMHHECSRYNSLDPAVVLWHGMLPSVCCELSAVRETLVTLVTPQVLVGTVSCHVGH